MERKCSKMDQIWSQMDVMGQNGPYGPKRTRCGPKRIRNRQKPYTDFIFPEHIYEQKWNRNAVRWTRHGPKWTILAKMDHMVQNGPDMGPNGLKNPSLLTWSFVSTFLNRNGTEMQQDGPDMAPKRPYGPKQARYWPKRTRSGKKAENKSKCFKKKQMS